MELAGGNPYRARAYGRAAENLALSPLPLHQLVAEGRLTEIPGIGEALAGVITQLHETGEHPRLQAMREEVPAGVLDMLRVPGLRRERVQKLYKELGLKSVADLEDAARSGRLAATKGFGAAFQAKVLQGLAILTGPQGRHLHRAAAALRFAADAIAREHPKWVDITPAGDFRRGCELVGALSLVAADPQLNGDDKTIEHGDELVVHVTTPARFGIALLLATGSDAHVDALRALARRKGLGLDRDGVTRKGRVLAQRTEQEVYAALGLPYIAPELRETGKEVQLALKGKLPELVTQDDLRGVLHAHTTESDGSDSLEDMAEATRKRGYAYLGLTDHSQSAHYAGGLKEEEVAKQQRAVDRLNKRYGSGFHVFKGIESDILGDGSLDYPDAVLASFDLVIASIHSKFRLSRKEQTDRLVKAIENPHTTILGHVTGRQLMRRPGYEVDMERVLRACAEHGVAIEINAHPWRLDMDWRWCERALALGCLFSINPDAHSTEEIDNIQWGVLTARKGAVPKERVLNAQSLSEFREHLQRRKERLRAATSRLSGKSRCGTDPLEGAVSPPARKHA
ncbi:DNA polymerase/3'-5' exonuclease PolX [Reyranella soli]|uniref:DNA polymerase/3'-5' exonuclease PolX n=2 Tax=Reyranella soli TaxID=1230389 RepID=A0A512NLQ9_9HYPH|nr:DNA polymerase/3'-5' exonuclease PolX [Reyranella soli]